METLERFLFCKTTLFLHKCEINHQNKLAVPLLLVTYSNQPKEGMETLLGAVCSTVSIKQF